MTKIHSTLFAAALAACTACGQQSSEASDTQAMAQQAANQSAVSSTLLQPTPLFFCSVGNESYSLVRQTRGTVSFGAETSALISASKTIREGIVAYSLQTAAGNDIDIRLPFPVAGSGSVVVFDRGVIGGQCDSGSIKIDLKSLDNLVADARPQPKYLFADCSWYSHPGAHVTVRKGLDPNTVVFEADLAEQGRGSEALAYVATGLHSGRESADIVFKGRGNISWSGLGRHAAAVPVLKLTNTGDLVFDTNQGTTFDPLVSCKVSNLNFVRTALSR